MTDQIGPSVLVPHSFLSTSRNISLSAKWLYVVLLSHGSNDGDIIYISLQKLMYESCLSKSTVANAVRELVSAKWVEHDTEHPSALRYVIQNIQEKTR